MTVSVEVRTLRKAFGSFVAVDGISFAVPRGEALSLLGPSGCGKTTTLRCIAGLEQPDAGEILIEGEVMAAPARGIVVPAEKRALGMVFQSYAVWPHLTVFDNIAFGLRTRKVPQSEIKRRVMRAIEQTNLVGLEGRYPSQLSGGQQQRVALGRAIVYEPQVLLMDEPLSNLDASLREQMRVELRLIQARLGITTIYVTHDQQEALTISDQIAVMHAGRIVQLGTPDEIYNRPSSRIVAEFVGKSNVLAGTVVTPSNGSLGRVRIEGSQGAVTFAAPVAPERRPGERVLVVVRPERWQFVPGPADASAEQIRGRIERRIFLGNLIEYFVDVGGSSLVVQAPPQVSLREGEAVGLRPDPEAVIVLDAEEPRG